MSKDIKKLLYSLHSWQRLWHVLAENLLPASNFAEKKNPCRIGLSQGVEESSAKSTKNKGFLILFLPMSSYSSVKRCHEATSFSRAGFICCVTCKEHYQCLVEGGLIPSVEFALIVHQQDTVWFALEVRNAQECGVNTRCYDNEPSKYYSHMCGNIDILMTDVLSHPQALLTYFLLSEYKFWNNFTPKCLVSYSYEGRSH